MFRAADAMLLTKTDLLAVLDDFDPAARRTPPAQSCQPRAGDGAVRAQGTRHRGVVGLVTD